MKGRKRFGAKALGVLLVLTLIAAACGDDDDAETTTTAAPATTAAPTTTAAPSTTEAMTVTDLTVLVSNPASYPFYESYVAVSEGFFEERGLNVEVVPVDGTPGIIQGFAADLGDIVFGDLGSLLRPAATEQFTPVTFYMVTNSGVFDIVVPDESPIQSGEELDGLVIGVNDEEDPGNGLIRSLNEFYGIETESLFTGTHTQALAAFDRGEIDAYAGSLPDIAVIEARGVSFRSVAPVEIRAVNGGSGFWAKRELMDANPDALTAFVAAIQEAHAWIDDDAEALVAWANEQEAIPEEEMPFNLALASALIGLRPTDVEPVGYISPDVWQTWWDGLVANETIDPSIGDPTDFYTNEFQS